MTTPGTDGDAEAPADPADPEQPPTPARSRRWRIATPAIGVLCGALLAISAAASDGTDLRPGRYGDLASLVQAESDRYDGLREQVDELQGDVDRLTADVDDAQVAKARREAEAVEDPAGLVAQSGAGVSITLSDAPTDVFDDALQSGADEEFLNRLVVHQQDIQAVVNALWIGGARAVIIEGQRVVSTTGIKCRGNAVQLQGVPYPEPYSVQAVGDPTTLMAAIYGDDRVTAFRSDADEPSIDVGWELQSETDVEAPAYDGLLDISYAKPIR